MAESSQGKGPKLLHRTIAAKPSRISGTTHRYLARNDSGPVGFNPEPSALESDGYTTLGYAGLRLTLENVVLRPFQRSLE